MNRSKLGVLSIIALLLLSFSVSLAAAQYTTEKTTDITIGLDGVFTKTEPDVGVSYVIQGVPGAVGSVTAAVYSGNPQAAASVPEGVSLSHFVVITFDMPSGFTSAEITISYSDSDVAGMDQPYAIYKYLSDSNSFVELPTTVDAGAHTLSVMLSSVDDPLLAVGGIESVPTSTASSTTWIIVAVAVVIIVLVAVILVLRWRRM